MKRQIPSMLLIPALSAMLSGCAANMEMPSLPPNGDTTHVGNVRVRLLDLATAAPVAIRTPPQAIPPELKNVRQEPYRVGPLDVLIVIVWEHPELTQPLGQYRNDIAAGQLVEADGTMYFPYAGRIKVAGLTTLEIQKRISESLSKILRDPQVDVKIAANRSQRILVSGEVRTPGILNIDDMPMTLAEALSRTGGVSSTGDASRLQLARKGKTYELDLDNLLQIGYPLDSIRLLPGDQIRVPRADDQVAYILGEVNRPSVLPLLNRQMSLVRALTEAGGYTQLSANTAGVYVVRASDSSNVTVFRLDGRSPVALAYAGQFQIRPRDLVYVDQSGISKWNKVLQLLVPTSSFINSNVNTANAVQSLYLDNSD